MPPVLDGCFIHTTHISSSSYFHVSYLEGIFALSMKMKNKSFYDVKETVVVCLYFHFSAQVTPLELER